MRKHLYWGVGTEGQVACVRGLMPVFGVGADSESGWGGGLYKMRIGAVLGDVDVEITSQQNV